MDQTQTTSCTSTSSDQPKDGSSFAERWHAAVPLPKDSALPELLERAIDILCPDLPHWEVKMPESVDDPYWEHTEAATSVDYGNAAYFLFNPRCGADTSIPVTLLCATVIHEVLHVAFYPVEEGIRNAFDSEDNLAGVLDGIAHQLIDTLAWRLVESIYPELEEETNEEVLQGPCVGDCGDVATDADCVCAG